MPPEPSIGAAQVYADGKFFGVGRDRFRFHGVTYGTFAPRTSDGARFPETAISRCDLSAIRAAGFTVGRTYTTPPDDVIEVAGERGLKLLADWGVNSDWSFNKPDWLAARMKNAGWKQPFEDFDIQLELLPGFALSGRRAGLAKHGQPLKPDDIAQDGLP